VLVPFTVVWQIGLILIIPVSLAAAVAATISTAMGAPDVAGLSGLGPDMMGWVMLARLVIPPIIVVIALLPMLNAGSDPGALNTTKVGNATVYALFAVGAAILYLRTRKPKHL
jgi:ABC-type glycerol-3-phosphate transport system permease component